MVAENSLQFVLVLSMRAYNEFWRQSAVPIGRVK